GWCESMCSMLCVRVTSCLCSVLIIFIFFFFQAEDGIRDDLVTGVQTCALPISIHALLGGRARLAEVHAADGVGELAQGREHDVRLDVHPDGEAVALAVFREVADAQMHRIRRALDVRDLAVDEDRPRLRTVRAEDGARDFRPPGADEARQAEYFA